MIQPHQHSTRLLNSNIDPLLFIGYKFAQNDQWLISRANDKCSDQLNFESFARTNDALWRGRGKTRTIVVRHYHHGPRSFNHYHHACPREPRYASTAAELSTRITAIIALSYTSSDCVSRGHVTGIAEISPTATGRCYGRIMRASHAQRWYQSCTRGT